MNHSNIREHQNIQPAQRIRQIKEFTDCRKCLPLLTAGLFILSSSASASDYRAELSIEYSGSQEYATLEVYDDTDQFAWSVTSQSPAAQLSNYALLESEGDLLYLVDAGTVTAYDAASGNSLWTNFEFNGSVAGDCYVIEDETLYLSGYLGPDYCVIASNGQTISRVENLNEGSYWPYHMEMNADGDIEITFESDESIRIIPKAGYINYVETEEGMYPRGRMLKVYGCDEYISLRDIPDSQGEVLRQMPKDASCIFLADQGNGYFYVRYETETGWINGFALASYLEDTGDDLGSKNEYNSYSADPVDCADGTCPVEGNDGYDYDICALALDHYEAATGYRPQMAYITQEVDGIVTIHLVDSFPDHEVTSDWYEIDRSTLTGTNFLGEEISLN